MHLRLRSEDYLWLVFLIASLLVSEGAESNKPNRKEARLYDDAGRWTYIVVVVVRIISSVENYSLL